jgi:hypothetical protein
LWACYISRVAFGAGEGFVTKKKVARRKVRFQQLHTGVKLKLSGRGDCFSFVVVDKKYMSEASAASHTSCSKY